MWLNFRNFGLFGNDSYKNNSQTQWKKEEETTKSRISQIEKEIKKLNKSNDSIDNKMLKLDKEVNATKELYALYKSKGVDINYNDTKMIIKNKKIQFQADYIKNVEEIKKLNEEKQKLSVEFYFNEFLKDEDEDEDEENKDNTEIEPANTFIGTNEYAPVELLDDLDENLCSSNEYVPEEFASDQESDNLKQMLCAPENIFVPNKKPELLQQMLYFEEQEQEQEQEEEEEEEEEKKEDKIEIKPANTYIETYQCIAPSIECAPALKKDTILTNKEDINLSKIEIFNSSISNQIFDTMKNKLKEDDGLKKDLLFLINTGNLKYLLKGGNIKFKNERIEMAKQRLFKFLFTNNFRPITLRTGDMIKSYFSFKDFIINHSEECYNFILNDVLECDIKSEKLE